MFCPLCRAEFRDGVYECNECDVPLVHELSDLSALALVPLIETRNPDQLSVLAERLEDTGVPYVIQAGTAMSLLPPSVDVPRGLPEPWEARVFVAASHKDQALAILRELRGQA